MLTIYRRHRKDCKHRSEGRKYRRCRCPIWVDGLFIGREIRKSLDSTDWQKAQDVVREMEATESEPKDANEPITIQLAGDKFLADANARKLNESTIYKYRLLFKQIGDFAQMRGLRYLKELELTTLDEFRSEWKDSPRSSLKGSNDCELSYDSPNGGSGSTIILQSTSKLQRFRTGQQCPSRTQRCSRFSRRSRSTPTELASLMRRGSRRSFYCCAIQECESATRCDAALPELRETKYFSTPKRPGCRSTAYFPTLLCGNWKLHRSRARGISSGLENQSYTAPSENGRGDFKPFSPWQKTCARGLPALFAVGARTPRATRTGFAARLEPRSGCSDANEGYTRGTREKREN